MWDVTSVDDEDTATCPGAGNGMAGTPSPSRGAGSRDGRTTQDAKLCMIQNRSVGIGRLSSTRPTRTGTAFPKACSYVANLCSHVANRPFQRGYTKNQCGAQPLPSTGRAPLQNAFYPLDGEVLRQLKHEFICNLLFNFLKSK